MPADLGLAPELRLTAYAYAQVFGHPPATVWRVPGTVTLLEDGPLRLTVATPWGAIVAAGPGDGDVIEVAKMERPGERDRLTLADAVAGSGPAWAGNGLRSASSGAALLVSSGLPAGVGVGVGAATEMAIRLSLTGQAGSTVRAGPHAMAGERRLPFDLGSAGLRLVVIDTRVRGVPRAATGEHSPVAAAADAISSGDHAALGPMLTAAHECLACDDEQDVAARLALRSGALGARAICDGPGRPVCALVPAVRLADVRIAVTREFARRKLRPPRFLTFTPAGGPTWVLRAGPPGGRPRSEADAERSGAGAVGKDCSLGCYSSPNCNLFGTSARRSCVRACLSREDPEAGHDRVFLDVNIDV